MPTIGFIGTGNMGGAIIQGLSARPDTTLIGFDPDKKKLTTLADKSGLVPAASILEAAQKSDVLILAVKPQQMEEAIQAALPSLSKSTVLVSIAAGIPQAKIGQWSNGLCPVVRVMPNTPALVGAGVFALCLEDQRLSEKTKTLIVDIFTTLGQVFVLPEKLFDAFTSVVGSGPAYVVYFMEALAEAAVTLGIPRSQAVDMVKGLFSGTAKLCHESDQSLSALREMVCSPGGTTLAGLNHFDRKAIRGALIDGVRKSFKRSQELGS